MPKTGIAIDEWKLPIFARYLKEAGYPFENSGRLTDDTLLLRVETTDASFLALGAVLRAANLEAFETGAPQ